MILYIIMSCVIIRRATLVPTRCMSAVSTLYHDMSTKYRNIFGRVTDCKVPPASVVRDEMKIKKGEGLVSYGMPNSIVRTTKLILVDSKYSTAIATACSSSPEKEKKSSRHLY